MRRGLKYMLILVVGFILLLVLLLGFIQTPFFKSKVNDLIIQQVENQLKLKVEIEKLEGNFYNNLSVQNIKFSDNDSVVAEFSNLYIEYDLRKLLGNVIHIDSILIENPQLNLWQNNDSTWNVSSYLKPTEKKAETSSKQAFNFTIKTKHLAIKNGNVSVASFSSLIPKQTNNLNLLAEGFYNSEKTNIHLKNFEFETINPSLVLNRLSGIYKMDENGIQLDNLLLLTGGSGIEMNAKYKSIENMSSVIDASKIDKNELAVFISSFKLLCSPSVKATFKTVNDSVFSQAEISYKNQSLKVNVNVNTLSKLIEKKQEVSYSAALKFNNFRLENWIETNNQKALIVGDIQLQGSNLLDPNSSTSILADLSNSIYDNIVFNTLAFRGNYANDNLISNLTIYTDFGDAQISGTLNNISSSRNYKAQIISSNFNVGRFVPQLENTEINGVILADGQLSDPNKYVSNAKLNLTNSIVYSVPIDTLRANVNMRNKYLFLDSLEANVPGAYFVGGGNVSLDSLVVDSYIYAEMTSIEFLDSLISLPLKFDSLTTIAQISGPLNTLTIGGDVELFNAAGYSVDIGKADVHYLVELIPDSLNVHLNTWTYSAKTDPVDWDTVRIDVNYAKSELDVDAYLNWRDTLTSRIKSRIIIKDTMTVFVPKFEINSFSSNFYMPDTMRASIYNNEELEIKNFTIKDKNQDNFSLSVNGNLSASDSNKVDVFIRQLNLSELNRFIGKQDSLKGLFETEIKLRGTSANPLINGAASVKNPEYGKYGLSSLETRFGFKDQHGFAELTSTDLDNSFLARIDAEYNAYFDSLKIVFDPPRQFSGTLLFNSVDISESIAAFVPNDSLKGVLTGKIEASGEWTNPLFYGKLDVTNGYYLNNNLGIDYNNIKTSVVFDGKKIRLDTLLVHQKNGLVSVNGEMEFDSTIIRGNIKSSSLQLDANKFFLTKHRNYEVLLDANTFVKTKNNKPEFGGKIKVIRSDVFLPAILSASNSAIDTDVPLLVEATKTPEDSTLLLATIQNEKVKQEKKVGAYSDIITGKLNIEIPRNTWIKSDDMRIELSGDVDVVKTGPYFELFGNIDIVRGYYVLYGRKLNLQESQIIFQGGEKLDPTLNIEAEYIYRSSDKEKRYLKLMVNGELSEPDITFLLDGTEITETDGISILVFGATSDEIGYGGQNGAIGSVSSKAVASVLTSQLSKTIGTQLKLDMIEITATESWQSAAFVVGKYITNDIFLIYQRGFGEVDGDEITQETVTIEYEINKNLFLRLQSGSAKESGVDVILKFEEGDKIQIPKRNKKQTKK